MITQVVLVERETASRETTRERMAGAQVDIHTGHLSKLKWTDSCVFGMEMQFQ